MRYRITTRANDGLAEAPAFTITVNDPDELQATVVEELCDEDGVHALPVGATLTIERVE